jgi:hypothetical protein
MMLIDSHAHVDGKELDDQHAADDACSTKGAA